MRDFLTKEGEKYGDFILINHKRIEELELILREVIHLPTGAQIMDLENDDPENLFCLSFQTLPDSSNGVPHILEHTVLCGSKKYPVKDPFFAMNRRSLTSFMNALTGSDFTCYPAATQVEKDFYNLLEVYLDAVFHPYLNELSFLQEGHRLEFSDPKNPNSPLQFKGIVYNEMKGALSSADSRIWHALMAHIVPDLPYAFNSGGDPNSIPNLTYKELIEFHETYYHPSRCLFYFYGNLSLKKHLDFIHEHALKGVPKLPPLIGIGHQKRFSAPIHKQLFYPTHGGGDLEKGHIHTYAWLTTPLINQEEVIALSILESALMDTDASPLKKALLSSKKCIHVETLLDHEMTEVPFIFLMRGCRKEDGEFLEELLRKELEKIADRGISYPLIEAAIYQLELSRTEIQGGHSPFGLTLFMRSALTKQHGCDPEHSLTLHQLFEIIGEKARNPLFFSPLIRKYFLDNPHFVQLSFAPDPDLPKKEADEEKRWLEEIYEGLKEKDKVQILEQTEKLKEFQERQEGQKLECLPKVTLDDIPLETRHFTLQQEKRKELNIFCHETFTNKIVYADLVWDLPNLRKEELCDLQLFILFWLELGMAGRSYAENLQFIHAHTGGVSAHVSLHVQADNPALCKPSIQIHGKTLSRKTDKLFQILEEAAKAPRFDETHRISDLIKKLHTSMENRFNRNAMRYASHLALKTFSIPSTISETWYGLSFYHYIDDLHRNLSRNLLPLIERLNALKEKLTAYTSPQLILSCDRKIYQEIDRKGFYTLPDLRSTSCETWKGEIPLSPASDQARIISSPLAFTVEGFPAPSYTHKDAPALHVATLLLENKVLHNRIREKGGAYGAGAQYNPLWGNFYFYAYRDPLIAHTLHTFEEAICEMAGGNFSPNDLEEAKLGIIQHLDAPIAPGGRGMIGYIWQRDGKTRQMRQNFRDLLLALNKKEVENAIGFHLMDQMSKGVVSIFAGQELFEKELPLLKKRQLEPLPISPHEV